MPTTIDSLQIEIQSSSTNASKGIEDLAKSLGELKKNGTVNVAIKNLNNLSSALKNFTDASNATRSVGKLVGSLSKLKEVGSVTSIGTSLTKLSTSLNALDKVNVDSVAPQIERIAEAVAPLSSIKAGGLSTMVNAMSKIGKVTADLDDAKIAAFADRIQKLNTVLEPLSTKMTTIQAGLRGINSSA
jgi:DNA repair exonuclease SbcCD ATPase subunit